MNPRYQFVLLFTTLFLALGVLLFLVFQEQKIYFVASELVLLVLIATAAKVYQNIFQPLRFIQQGIEALRDEDFNIKFSQTGKGEIDNLVEVYNQMIDKIRHERVYQQEQHFFLELMLDALPVGILILDYDDQLSQYNTSAKSLLQLRREDIGQPLSTLPHPIGRELAQLENRQSQIIKQDSIDYYRCTANRFMHKGFPRRFIVIEELSEDLLRAEKQAYGKVIRMMSHEVNNSIGAINSILHSLLTESPINAEEVAEYLPIVVDRNVRLSQFMKNFAKVIRLPLPDKNPCNLVDILQDLQQLFKPQCEERQIKLSLHTPPELSAKGFPLQADREQLEQALLNILKNSLEAIGKSGHIRMTLQSSSPQLVLSDNGSGILPEVADQLFTPFFSTKRTGQGVGLTLVKEIFYHHGFGFRLYSEGGETRFEVSV